ADFGAAGHEADKVRALRRSYRRDLPLDAVFDDRGGDGRKGGYLGRRGPFVESRGDAGAGDRFAGRAERRRIPALPEAVGRGEHLDQRHHAIEVDGGIALAVKATPLNQSTTSAGSEER